MQIPRVRVELFAEVGCRGAVVSFDPSHVESNCDSCFDTCNAKFPNQASMHQMVHSMRVVSDDVGDISAAPMLQWSVSAYSVCAGEYQYSKTAVADSVVVQALRPEHSCLDIAEGPKANFIRFDGIPHLDDIYEPKSYHVVYSAESSTYFGFQAYANLHAFQQSGQQQSPPTGYTRLLTARTDDDLATRAGGVVPTFTRPRDAYSHIYSPINKPHVIAGFMADPSGPKEEVIVIIDPDNWLTMNLAPIAGGLGGFISTILAFLSSLYFPISPCLCSSLFPLAPSKGEARLWHRRCCIFQ
jgi:hypothetical protein